MYLYSGQISRNGGQVMKEKQVCDCCLRLKLASEMGKYQGRDYCNDCIADARLLKMNVKYELGSVK